MTCTPMMDLLAWRKGQGMTQQEVADSLGVTNHCWSRWERANLIPIDNWTARNDFLLLYQHTGIGILDVWPELRSILL